MSTQSRAVRFGALFLAALVALASATEFDDNQHEQQMLAGTAEQEQQFDLGNPEFVQRLHRRQVTYPILEQPGAAGPPPVGAGGPPGSNMLGFLSNLGPQLASVQDSAKMLSSPLSGLFNTNPQQAAAQAQLQQAFQPGQQPSSPLSSGIPSAGQVMGQLSELIRATQERSAKAVSGAQQTATAASEQVSQQTAAAASQAQGGISSALAEIGQGLKRIATNNPSLLPDVKNLYQSVSSKLTSASSSVAQVANPSAGPNGPFEPVNNGANNVPQLSPPGQI